MKTIDQTIRAAMEPPTKAEQDTTPQHASRMLEAFDTCGDPQLVVMKQAAEDFCTAIAMRREPRWLSLLGSSGAGKTMLARIIFRFVKERARYFRIIGASGEPVIQAHEVLWVNWREAAKDMSAGCWSTIDALIERSSLDHAIWFAVIDDIGAADEAGKRFVLNALDHIADARLGMWTVFTSNLTPDQIASKLDPRISSRMIRGKNVVVKVEVEDFNLRKLWRDPGQPTSKGP